MKIELWAPTEYWFELPKIRHDLAERFLSNNWKLLDYGSGNGSNTILFENGVREVIGVEVEPERHLESIAYGEKHSSQITYILYDWSKLPLSNNSIDNVISFEVIEHTNNDTDAIKDINRVLVKWWNVIITVPNKRYLMETHWFHGWISKFIPTNRIPFLSRLPTCIHEKRANARIYTKSRIINLLKNNWFEIVHHEYIMPPLDKLKNKFLQKRWRRILNILNQSPLRFLATSHFIVWKKK